MTDDRLARLAQLADDAIKHGVDINPRTIINIIERRLM